MDTLVEFFSFNTFTGYFFLNNGGDMLLAFCFYNPESLLILTDYVSVFNNYTLTSVANYYDSFLYTNTNSYLDFFVFNS